MSGKFISLGMLFALVLIGRLLLPASALAQVAPSPSPTSTPTPESTKVFSAGGKTIGGPGDFTGPCDTTTRDVLSGGTKPACLTVENTGDCVVQVFLRDAKGTVINDAGTTIPPGTAHTVCSDKKVVVSIGIVCLATKGGKTCSYRWRIDDNSE
jgi:hypothetical protein